MQAYCKVKILLHVLVILEKHQIPSLIGARAIRTAKEVCEASDVIIVAVKPYQISEVLKPIAGLIDELLEQPLFLFKPAGILSDTRICLAMFMFNAYS